MQFYVILPDILSFLYNRPKPLEKIIGDLPTETNNDTFLAKFQIKIFGPALNSFSDFEGC